MRHTLISALVLSAPLCAQIPATEPVERVATSSDLTLTPSTTSPDYRDAIGVSLYWENDGTLTDPIETSDQWYTSGSGVAVQWQSPGTTEVLSKIPSIAGEFDADRPGVSYAGGFLVSMNIYTPKSILDPEIRPDDRPYAGWAYAGFIGQRANRDATTPVFEHWELDAGALGPMSRAGDVQKWVHKNFDEQHPEGWEYQVRDEVGLDLKYQRRWRFDLMTSERPTGPGLQLIPDAGATLGTLHINAAAGATLRFGWNLPDDFGPGSMRYADDFTRPLGSSDGLDRGISGYFFMRPGVRAVAHDATLGNSFFRNDNPVEADSQPVGGDVAAGVVVTFFRHWRFGWTHTFVSPEFKGQGAWHSFGALTLSGVYAW